MTAHAIPSLEPLQDTAVSQSTAIGPEPSSPIGYMGVADEHASRPSSRNSRDADRQQVIASRERFLQQVERTNAHGTVRWAGGQGRNSGTIPQPTGAPSQHEAPAAESIALLDLNSTENGSSSNRPPVERAQRRRCNINILRGLRGMANKVKERAQDNPMLMLTLASVCIGLAQLLLAVLSLLRDVLSDILAHDVSGEGNFTVGGDYSSGRRRGVSFPRTRNGWRKLKKLAADVADVARDLVPGSRLRGYLPVAR